MMNAIKDTEVDKDLYEEIWEKGWEQGKSDTFSEIDEATSALKEELKKLKRQNERLIAGFKKSKVEIKGLKDENFRLNKSRDAWMVTADERYGEIEEVSHTAEEWENSFNELKEELALKNLEFEVKYKLGKGYVKFDDETIHIDFNEDGDWGSTASQQPVSIYWDSKSKKMNEMMDSHYSVGSNYYDNTCFLDWGFMKPIKEKYWTEGKKLHFWIKTNADGYFNIWLDENYTGLSHYIDEKGVLYFSLIGPKFKVDVYGELDLAVNRCHEAIDCRYNREIIDA